VQIDDRDRQVQRGDRREVGTDTAPGQVVQVKLAVEDPDC